jgi:hypothetical protein
MVGIKKCCYPLGVLLVYEPSLITKLAGHNQPLILCTTPMMNNCFRDDNDVGAHIYTDIGQY